MILSVVKNPGPSRRKEGRPGARKRRDGTSPLAGLRILLVEDEFFVALSIERALHALGCDTIGPLATLADALAAAKQEAIGGALLDINLGGEMVYPVADELMLRGIPFVFATGYDAVSIPERFRGHPCLQKPFGAETLKEAVQSAFAPDDC